MRVICKNMTQAMKAGKLLNDSGIYAKVVKITDLPDVNGCVYSVNFKDPDFEKAINIMKNNGVILHKKEKNYYGDEWL